MQKNDTPLLIEVQDLAKIYSDGTAALRGVTFSIPQGAFVAIMGPSGSGKSTLLHILGFLDPQTSGTYRFKDRAITDFSRDELAYVRNKDMGFVFQAFNLLPHTSVMENVTMPLYYSDVPERQWRERAYAAIEAVGLLHRLEHQSHELSGGEKQRVAIARALINDPHVIFADEPTGNLDSAAGDAVMDILVSLHRAGKTIILITHSDVLGRRAERMLTMRDGLLVSNRAIRHAVARKKLPIKK